MKQDTQDGMNLVEANVNKMKVFAMISKDRIKINADVNSKN